MKESHSVKVWPPIGPPSNVAHPGINAAKKRLQRLPADPRLYPEPPARYDRSHQGGQIRSDRAVSRLAQIRERGSRILCPDAN
jgi:hypothetical protein